VKKGKELGAPSKYLGRTSCVTGEVEMAKIRKKGGQEEKKKPLSGAKPLNLQAGWRVVYLE